MGVIHHSDPALILIVDLLLLLFLKSVSFQLVNLRVHDHPLDVAVEAAEVLFGFLADDFFGVFLLFEVVIDDVRKRVFILPGNK